MNSVETKISGSQLEQCQVNMVGEVKDPSQVHAALFGLIKTHVVLHYLVETQLSFCLQAQALMSRVFQPNMTAVDSIHPN